MNNVSLSGKLYGLQTKVVGSNNTQIASFRIGVYNSRANKSFYFPVTVFGKNEFLTKYFSNDGALVEVTGRLEVEEWEKDEVKHSKTLVIATDVSFVPKAGSAKTEDAEATSNTPTEMNDTPPLPDEAPF